MKYRPDYLEVTGRIRRLIASEKKGSALIFTSIPSANDEPYKPIYQWEFPRQLFEYIDYRTDRTIEYWRQRQGLLDDALPCDVPWFGIAEHTAFLGGEVTLEEDTSYNHTILPDWDGFDKLVLDPGHMWMKMITDGIRHIKNTKKGELFAKLRGADGPFDIANIVRGNQIFYDLYDYPERVHRLMDFCAKATRFTVGLQKAEADLIDGGYIVGSGVWLPEKAMGHLSDDIVCMLTTEIYEEFGLPYLKKAVEGMDNVFLHTHSLGRKNLPLFATVDEIKIIEVASDPNAPRSVEALKEYSDPLRDKIIDGQFTRQEIENSHDLFKTHKSIICYSAESYADAEDMIAYIRGRYPVE